MRSPSNHPAVWNLATTYVVRRDLSPVIAQQVLAKRGITLEEFGLLLDLYGAAKLGWPSPPCDPEGYVTQKALETTLSNSQPHVSRRVGHLLKSGYLTLASSEGQRSTGSKRKVGLTPTGVELMASLWADYQALANGILASVSLKQRQQHLAVCQHISALIKPRMFLSQPTLPRIQWPIDNVLALFEMARNVRKPIKEETLAGTNLSVERADVLVILFLARSESSGSLPGEPHAGYVLLSVLRDRLVHSLAPSKFLISRWLAQMGAEGWVETRSVDERRKEARITPMGIAIIEPVWERYRRLAEQLLQGVPTEDRVAHYEVNEAMSRALRPFWLKATAPLGINLLAEPTSIPADPNLMAGIPLRNFVHPIPVLHLKADAKNLIPIGTDAGNMARVIEGKTIRQDGTLDLTRLRYGVHEPGMHLLIATDICVRRITGLQASTLHVAVVPIGGPPLAALDTVIVLRPTKPFSQTQIDSLIAQLRSPRCMDFLRARGAGISITAETLMNFPVSL